MKAYLRLRPAAIAALACATALAGACSGEPVAPAPAPQPRPAPAPLPDPPAPPPRTSVDWRTAPITAGDWQWSSEAAGSLARFAGERLVLVCDRSAGTVTLMRSGSAPGPVAMTIVTSSIERPVTGEPRPGPPPAVAVSFPASDPILDAMAFSRGRFAIEATGLETLYVPSWPEVSRVVEDCR